MSFFGGLFSRKSIDEPRNKPNEPGGLEQQSPEIQLRSPSPTSDLGSGNAPPRSVTPSKSDAGRNGVPNLSPRHDASMYIPDGTPNEALQLPLLPSTTLSQEEEEVDPADLLALLRSIPPIILHTYCMTHLPTATPTEIVALSSFFDTLSPPPRLHCVRCHKDYVEVENDDRGCRVAHDDESAEVEHLGKVVVGWEKNSAFETLWGCCGKTTEGDGDLGPPDGWCYEGRHTTDSKRARFRADATPQDDKLTPCTHLGCFGERPSMAKRIRSSRTRPRRTYKEDGTDDDDDQEDAEEEADDDAMDVDGDASPKRGRGGRPPVSKASTTGGGKGRTKKPADDAISISISDRVSIAESTKSKSGKGKGKPVSAGAATAAKPPPKPRAPRKQKSAVDLSSVAATSGSAVASPTSATMPPPTFDAILLAGDAAATSASMNPPSKAVTTKKTRARSVSAKPRSRKPKVAAVAPEAASGSGSSSTPPVPSVPAGDAMAMDNDSASIGGESSASATRGRTRKVVSRVKGKGTAKPSAQKHEEVEEEEEEAAKPKKKRKISLT